MNELSIRAVQGAIKAVRKHQSDEELKLVLRRAVKNAEIPASRGDFAVEYGERLFVALGQRVGCLSSTKCTRGTETSAA